MTEQLADDDRYSVVSDYSDRHISEREKEEEIAREETRCVVYLRFLTFGFLLATASVVFCMIFVLLRAAEESKLEAKFHDNAGKLLEAIGTLFENILMDVDSFAVFITTQAKSMQEATGNDVSWPFVTFPNIAVQGSKLRALSKIFLFSIYHYIEHADRNAWENYTRANDGWVDQGIESQKSDPTFRGNIVEEWNTLGQINFYGQRAQDADFYIARWQSSPIVVSAGITNNISDHVVLTVRLLQAGV